MTAQPICRFVVHGTYPDLAAQDFKSSFATATAAIATAKAMHNSKEHLRVWVREHFFNGDFPITIWRDGRAVR